MKPGRDLDTLVADKIMGLDTSPLSMNQKEMRMPFAPKPYSTDTAAAWQVVEKLISKYRFELYFSEQERSWCCSIVEVGPRFRADLGVMWADTAPYAICLAALKAAGL